MKTCFLAAFFLQNLATAYSQSGGLDITFDNDGVVIADSDTTSETCASLIVQPDGKVIAVGSYQGSDLIMLRYNVDGSPDSTFGENGAVTVDFNGNASIGTSVSLQEDGKIVVAGQKFNGSNEDPAVCRFAKDGTIDTSFGESGMASVDITGGLEYGNSIQVSEGNKIYIGGYVSGVTNDLFVIRYDSLGLIDSTFGKGGISSLDVDSGLAIIYAMAIDNENRVVLCGTSYDLNGNKSWDLLITRFLKNGVPDSSFDTDGIKVIDIGSKAQYARDVAILPDNRIIVVGFSDDFSEWRMTAILLQENGGQDSSFAGDGILMFYPNPGQAYGVAIQPDLKILIAGRVVVGFNSFFGMVRCDLNGNPDSTFGISGMVTHHIHPYSDDYATSIALAPDGNIVTGGWFNEFGLSETGIFILRYLSDFPTQNEYECSPEELVKIFPNPSPGISTIQFTLLKDSEVRIEILDAFSHKIKTLNNRNYQTGTYSLSFSTQEFPSGIYFIRLVKDNEMVSTKMIIQ